MDITALEFARPWWLAVTAALCLLLAWLMWRFDQQRERALSALVHPRFRERLVPGHSASLRRTRRILWLLAVLLLGTAAAGPRAGFEWRKVKRRGIDLLFAIDTSRSMLAEDLQPNRLDRARMGIHDFVQRLNGDRVGLIPFAGSAFALCPLTLDYDAFGESLDALDTDLIPRQGTDVASAIREANRLFTEKGNNHRILVLITDGEDLQGNAVEAAKEAAKDGMVIYPVGVGSTEGASIPLRLPNGKVDQVRDDNGNIVRTRLDETTLRNIAKATGGLYVGLGRGAEGLNTIYNEKLRLVPEQETQSRMEKVPLERFEWPLAAALLLLLIEFLLPERRRERKAAPVISAARRHAPTAAMVLLLSAASDEQLHASDAATLYNEGTAAYEAGDFAKATAKLREALVTPDLKLQQQTYYNLGNALYRSGQQMMQKRLGDTVETWESAIKAYDDALALNPEDADAKFNRDLVQRKLDEMSYQQGKGGGKPDDEKPDSKKQDGKKQDGKKQDGKKQDGKKQDGKEQDGKEQDGEKQDGAKASEEAGQQAAPIAEESRGPQQMTAEEARQLLQSLRRDDRMVIPLDRPPPQRRFRDPANSVKGKTW